MTDRHKDHANGMTIAQMMVKWKMSRPGVQSWHYRNGLKCNRDPRAKGGKKHV